MKDNRFTVEGFTNALTGKIKKQMNKLEIEIPEGHEIDQEKSNLEKGLIIFKKKKSRPMRFEDVDTSNACGLRFKWEGRDDSIRIKRGYGIEFIALNKLIWLRDEWNEGWAPDWASLEEVFVIGNTCILGSGELMSVYECDVRMVFAFKTEQTAKAFLEQFRELIEQARPLL